MSIKAAFSQRKNLKFFKKNTETQLGEIGYSIQFILIKECIFTFCSELCTAVATVVVVVVVATVVVGFGVVGFGVVGFGVVGFGVVGFGVVGFGVVGFGVVGFGVVGFGVVGFGVVVVSATTGSDGD